MTPRSRRPAASLLATLVITAAGLRVLDAVPRAITGLPRGVVRLASLDAAADRAGSSLPLPSYLPEDLEWPPSDVLAGASASVALMSRRLPDGARWLILACSPARAGAIDTALLPAATVLQETDLALDDGRTLNIRRLQDAGGALWHQASWQAHTRLILVRTRGPLDELVRIARSVRERSRDDR